MKSVCIEIVFSIKGHSSLSEVGASSTTMEHRGLCTTMKTVVVVYISKTRENIENIHTYLKNKFTNNPMSSKKNLKQKNESSAEGKKKQAHPEEAQEEFLKKLTFASRNIARVAGTLVATNPSIDLYYEQPVRMKACRWSCLPRLSRSTETRRCALEAGGTVNRVMFSVHSVSIPIIQNSESDASTIRIPKPYTTRRMG